MIALASVPLMSGAADFTIEIKKATPVIDGTVSEGEYLSSYVMNSESATAWVGDVGASSVTWYFAWDENGLYYAGTINDTTPVYRTDSEHWVGADALELAINPGFAIEGEGAEGIFFSFGAKADGGVVAYRHNYSDGIVSGIVKAASSGHTVGSDSYTIEVFLPWSIMKLDTDCTVYGKENIHIDTTGFKAEAGAVIGLLPCAIDALYDDPAGTDGITAAYKFNGTDLVVTDFIKAALTDSSSESAENAKTESAAKGCGTVVLAPSAFAIALAAAVVISKKK